MRDMWWRRAEYAQEACTLICRDQQKLQIMEIQPNTYLVSHANHDTALQCAQKDQRLLIDTSSNTELGATLVKLPCNCRLLHAGKTMVSSVFPCDSTPGQLAQIKSVIPRFWAKSKISGNLKLKNTGAHFGKILNLEWAKEIKVINLTKPTKSEPLRLIPKVKIEGYISFDWLLLVVLLQTLMWGLIIWINPHLIIPACILNRAKTQQRQTEPRIYGPKRGNAPPPEPPADRPALHSIPVAAIHA